MSENAAAPAMAEGAAPAPNVPVMYDIPNQIAEMVAAETSGPYQFQNFIYTVDKHVKFDVDAAENWQSLVSIVDWAQTETSSCHDATYPQFLREVAFRAKKGHYIFREDETLKPMDVSTVFFKAKPGWKELMGRHLPENEFMEHVKPIVKALGKFMYQTYKKNPAEAMNKTWDHQELINLIYNNTWKHRDPPNFGWTPEKMHRAFHFDPLTYESNHDTHTCKFLNWNNVVNYHLTKDFDPKNPPGEWAQAAQGKGQKREADGDWSNFGWPKTTYKGKGPGKNPEAQGKESSYSREDDMFKGSPGWDQDAYNAYWGYDAGSSSSWDSRQNKGGKGNGKGSNQTAD